MSKDFIERPRKNEKDRAITYVQELLKQAREDRRNEDVDKLENLIRLLNTKKYGLVWEEHAELVEEEMKTKIPVFIEDETKKIVGNPESEDYNFLLEGDNLHSLHLLKKTHTGKIDVIYIDPPYNTGNKDFIYNDKIVDKNDGYSHSKWLSFMSKRLEIARELLSDEGVIFISIDDNEQAQLKLLCDEVLGAENFVGEYIKQSKVGGGNDSKFIVKEHEYCLCYAKNIKVTAPMNIEHDDSYLKRYKEEDEYGRYFWDTFARPGLKNPIIYNIIAPDGTKINNGWIRSEERFKKEYSEGKIRITKKKNGEWSVQFKQYLNPNGKRPRSMTMDFGGTTEGDKEIKSIFGRKVFSYPKSVKFLLTLISTVKDNNIYILDFFAGSGTTGHAVMQLNKEDGGNRKYILCTNNENKIAEEITYKRLSNIQEELPHNLKYFKTDFVVKEDFPDVTLEYELLNYITPLVELEFGIDISNPKVQIILSEEQLDAMHETDFIEDSTLFFHPEIFFDADQERILREKNITKQEIPHYYFGKEMWS
ncbi:site-specific DNA-methyltransferase [Streptococcus hyointestinalis]|uniref:site-specific DNA-methyltransferase n=1 Tax=Streptococcus TaxID=1301 RepID=UPI0004222FCE|nr:site-specific DNA-methyltransferase [Streptococcus porci]